MPIDTQRQKSNDQETVCLNMAYLSYRAEMWFHNDINQEYYIRTLSSDTKVSAFKNINQIKEVLEIISHMKGKIIEMVNKAQHLDITLTKEFE